jgi:ABC-2 type transport system permease protein
MNPTRIKAVTVRIIRQFRRDPRTLAMLFVVPIVLLSLLGYIIRGSESTLELGIVEDDTSPFAQALAERLDADKRLDVSRLAESTQPETALERESLDGVLAGSVLLVDGSNPGDAATIAQVLRETIPAVSLQQASHQPVPEPALETRFVHGGPEFDRLDFLAPVFIGFFAFFLVFLLTSVSFLRERMQGSIERLLASPISRPEIVTGYMLGFVIFAAIQSAVIIGFSIYVLDVHHVGNLGLVFFVTLLLTIGSVNLGIFLSMFARTELQVVQFMPAVIVPQALLSGMIWPVESLPDVLRWTAYAMPLTWANDALRGIMIRGEVLSALSLELGVLAGFAVIMVVLSSITLRRRVA